MSRLAIYFCVNINAAKKTVTGSGLLGVDRVSQDAQKQVGIARKSA